MKKNMVMIEENQRFSNSQLWRMQREFYDREGVDAWSSDVPFYITSNSFIAKCYANLTLRFIQEWAIKHPDEASDTFYIAELGCGTGQFSFYVIKHMLELRKDLNLEHLNFCYILTDFTENNVKFWRQHRELVEFADQGVADFAVFDVEHDDALELQHSGKRLTKQDIKTPLIVYANYLFDSIVNDVFYVKDGKTYESLISVKTPSDNYVNNLPKSWEKLEVSYEDREIDGQYYDDEAIQKVLMSYQEDFDDMRFLMPIGALSAINRLQQLGGGRLFLLSSDKGNAADDEFVDADNPELDFHGSFSVMVNYNALSRYFKQQGGDSFMQNQRDAIITTAFSLGFDFDGYGELTHAFNQFVRGFSPADYFNLYEHVEDKAKYCSLDMITSLLNLSDWDPGVYDVVSDRVSDLIEKAEDEIVEYLAENLHKVADNFYFIPETNDVLFDIGVFYHETDDFVSALKYYDRSRKFFELGWEIEFNSGYCYYHLDRFTEALECFKQALTHDPKCRETKDWIKKTEKHCLQYA